MKFRRRRENSLLETEIEAETGYSTGGMSCALCPGALRGLLGQTNAVRSCPHYRFMTRIHPRNSTLIHHRGYLIVMRRLAWRDANLSTIMM